MKKFLAAVLVAVGLLAVPALAGTTLRVVGVNHPYVDAIKNMIPEFEKETGIKVALETYGEDQLGQKLTTEFAAGGSSVDVFSTRPPQDARVMHRNGWYADLAGYIKDAPGYDWDDFTQSAHDAVTFNGFVVAVPTVNECHVMYYRKDLLEAQGLKVPTTMDELYDVVGKITDKQNDIAGIALRGQRSPLVTQFSSFLFSYGGDFFKDGKATINTPEVIAAMMMYGKLLHNYGPDGALNMSWPQAAAVFAQGKAGFWIDASSLSSNVLDPAKSVVADKTGVAAFVAGPAGAKPYNISQWALGIYSGSKNKDAAWKFVEFMTNKKGITYMQGVGLNQCPRKSVWETPEGTANFHPEWVKAVAASAITGVPYDRPLLAAVGEARDIIGEVVTAAIEGRDEKTVKDRADAANVRFQALLDRENK